MRTMGFTVGWVVFLTAVGAALGTMMGWIPPAVGMTALGGSLALGGLFLVVKLPWDLYFAARELASLEALEDEGERERVQAGRWVPRLLALALGLHAVGALVCVGSALAGLGAWGYGFALAFVLATGLRPVGALHEHLSARLRRMSDKVRYPVQDVRRLEARVAEMEHRLDTFSTDTLPAFERRLEEGEVLVTERLAKQQSELAKFDRKVDRVLDELARSVERLTRDRELLAGLRAFVKLVKEH